MVSGHHYLSLIAIRCLLIADLISNYSFNNLIRARSN